MSLSIRPLLSLALVCALAACQHEAAPPPAAAPATTPAAPAPAAPAPATPAAPVASAPVAAADSLGIPECDDYLTRYEACVNSKVPEATKATLQQSLAQMRTAWKAAATTDAGKQSLAAACKQAHDGAKAMMQQYGCSDF